MQQSNLYKTYKKKNLRKTEDSFFCMESYTYGLERYLYFGYR